MDPALKSEPRKLASDAFLLVLLLSSTWAFWLVLRPYFWGVFYAIVLALFAAPVHKRINPTKERSWLKAGAALTIILLVVMVPLTVLLALLSAQLIHLGGEATKTLDLLTNQEAGLSGLIQRLPLGDWVHQHTAQIDTEVAKLGSQVMGGASKQLSKVAAGSMALIVQAGVSLFIALYFIVDGHRLLERFLYAMPMRAEFKQQLVSRVAVVCVATIKGSGVVALAQGLVGGLALWVAGVPYSLVWGVLIALFALIPAAGSALIWGPATVWLFLQGNNLAGTLLLIFNLVVVGNLDNVLRPMLIGRDTNLPDPVVFLATLGGLSLFGLHGLVLGPLIAAVTVSIWELYMMQFEDVLHAVSLDKAEVFAPENAPPLPAIPEARRYSRLSLSDSEFAPNSQEDSLDTPRVRASSPPGTNERETKKDEPDG